jgi:hypothetical protein
MDKSQKGPPGWNISDNEPGGKEHYVKPAKSKGVAKDALKSLNKEMDKAHKNKEMSEEMAQMEAELEEHGKASRELCKSAKPDGDLGASMLASCKSQGLRARDGEKSHKLGKDKKSRIKVGGHRIKGQKYGGPLPDWS